MDHIFLIGIGVGILIWMTFCLIIALLDKKDEIMFLSLGIYFVIIAVSYYVGMFFWCKYIIKNYSVYRVYFPKQGRDEWISNIYIHNNIKNRFNFANVNDPYVRFDRDVLKNEVDNFKLSYRFVSKRNFDKRKKLPLFKNIVKPEYRNIKKQSVNDGINKNT